MSYEHLQMNLNPQSYAPDHDHETLICSKDESSNRSLAESLNGKSIMFLGLYILNKVDKYSFLQQLLLNETFIARRL